MPSRHRRPSPLPGSFAVAACLLAGGAALVPAPVDAAVVMMVDDIDTTGTPLYEVCHLSPCPPPSPLYGSLPSQLTAVDRRLTEHAVQWRLAFVAHDRVHGAELWFSDATAEGTHLVADLRPGAAGSEPQILGPLGNGELLFLADDGTAGERIWKTDGTAPGTVPLVDPRPEHGSGPEDPYGPDVSDLVWLHDRVPSVRFDGKVWFALPRSQGGSLLWASDGTVAGTAPAFECGEETCGAAIQELLVVGGRLYVGVRGRSTVPPSLWVVEAGGGPPIRVAEGCTPRLAGPEGFAALGATLLFESPCLSVDPTGAARYGLYASQGAPGDATLLIGPLDQDALGRLVAFAGAAWVAVNDEDGGTLWRTDGTKAGTAPVLSGFDRIESLAALDDRLLFVSRSAAGSPTLHSTDASGSEVVDLLASDLGSPVVVGGQAIFSGTGPGGDREPWRTDGTELGTWRIADVAPGDASSAPRDLVQVAAWVFFSADDGEHGRELWALDWVSLEFPCPEGELCLADGRFRVEVEWDDGRGGTGIGQPAEHSESSGLFSFFHPDNWELLAKVLDGCGVNGHHWIFSAAATNVGYTLRVRDVVTGLSWEGGNPPGRPAPAIFDTEAFPCDDPAAAGPPAAIAGEVAEASAVPAVEPLTPPLPLHFLHGGRFTVGANWTDFQGMRGTAFPVVGGERSGVFTFFRSDNWELLAKVLDGCALNGHWWVLAAAPTTVGFELVVNDHEISRTWRFENPVGRPAPAVLDTLAFPCAP